MFFNHSKAFLAPLLLALALLLAVPALAAIEDDCGQTPCVCFLQEGDEGIAVEGVTALLAAQGYLPKKSATFTKNVTAAVVSYQSDNGLEKTGMLDDDTLTLLVFGKTSDELTAADGSSDPNTVWVPVNGGKKRHGKSTCSGMDHPRKMSVRNAEALGIEPCKKCKSK